MKMKKVFAMIIVGITLFTYWAEGHAAKSEFRKTAAMTEVPKNFNHDATSFPLVGAHRSLQCAQCHLGGRYKSLPTVCANCHNGQIAYGKPKNHLMTTENCNSCHTASAWTPATYVHEAASAGQCISCHNGQKATGKPQNHIATTQQCDTCHRTTAWVPAVLTNHDNPKLIGAHSTLDCKVCHTQSFASAFYRDGTRLVPVQTVIPAIINSQDLGTIETILSPRHHLPPCRTPYESMPTVPSATNMLIIVSFKSGSL